MDRARGHTYTHPSTSSRPLNTNMSRIHPNASSSSSSSNFQSVLNAALEAYERKTKSKLLTHPLAAQLQSCDSPTAILSVLQDLVGQFDLRRRGDERLTKWLTPTVNVLYALSSTVGQGVGLVSPNSLSSSEPVSRSSFLRHSLPQTWYSPASAFFFW